MNGAISTPLRAKWNYLRNHPGFQRAPVVTLLRLLSWRTHCALGITATIDLPKWGAQMFLPAKWGGAGTTMIYAVREDHESELAYLECFLSPGNVVAICGSKGAS